MNLESGMLLLVLFFTCMLYATIGAIFSLFDPGTCMNLESGMLILVLFFYMYAVWPFFYLYFFVSNWHPAWPFFYLYAE